MVTFSINLPLCVVLVSAILVFIIVVHFIKKPGKIEWLWASVIGGFITLMMYFFLPKLLGQLFRYFDWPYEVQSMISTSIHPLLAEPSSIVIWLSVILGGVATWGFLIYDRIDDYLRGDKVKRGNALQSEAQIQAKIRNHGRRGK